MNKSKKIYKRKNKTIKNVLNTKNETKNTKHRKKDKKRIKHTKKNKKMNGGARTTDELIEVFDEISNNIQNYDNLEVIRTKINEYPEIVNYVLTLPDSGNNTNLIQVAIMYNNIDVLNLLIEKGAYLNKVVRKVTPLTVSLMFDAMGCFELLIENGADVNAKNETNTTPIYVAIQKNNLDAFLMLLEHGANINVKDDGLSTPLHEASSREFMVFIQILLDNGANIDDKDMYMMTPLFYAIAYNSNYYTVQFLLERGANPNVRSMLGNTPLDVACSRGKIDFVTLLLIYGADVNTQDKYTGVTPLMIAAKLGHLNIIKLLLERGANICTKDDKNQTVLAHIPEGDIKDFLTKKFKEKIRENVVMEKNKQKIIDVDLNKEREQREIEAKKIADELIASEIKELEKQKIKLQEEEEKKKAIMEKQTIKKIIEEQEKKEKEELKLFSQEEEYYKQLLTKQLQHKLYLEELEKQKEEERKVEEEENKKLQKEIDDAIKVSLRTYNSDNEKNELFSFWSKYFDNEENIKSLKTQTIQLIKERNSFDKLKTILPAYTNSYVENNPYISNIISLLFILTGILSNILQKHRVYILLKGGSAIQFVGSSVSNDFIIPYSSNDIDIMLINENTNIDNKFLAEKICKLLVWLTEENDNSILSYVTNTDITYPIFKIILNSNKKPLVDIDYSKINNTDKRFDMNELYSLHSIYSKDFTPLNNFVGTFHSLNIMNLINSRIYYLIKYTEINEIKNAKNRSFFLNKIPKSINYLIQIYFILQNNREMTECDEPIIYNDLFNSFFIKYGNMKTDFTKTHSDNYSINDLISFILQKKFNN